VLTGVRAQFASACALAILLAGCGGSDGSETGEANDPTPAPAPTVSLDASAASVVSGNTTTLTWSSQNANSCTASGGWTGTRATAGSESTPTLTANATFTLACTGAGGTANDSATVTVTQPGTPPPPPPPAPTLTLTANPTSVATGGNSTLTWSSTNATSCTASGGWTGNRAVSGTLGVGPLSATTTYSLNCTGTGGSISRSATVTVSAAPPPPPPTPTVNLSASPTSVASGGSTQLTWSSTNATSCTASGGWSGTKATSGNQTISGLTANTTFTLQCTGTGGNATANANVTISAGGSGLQGQVDSSLIKELGTNRVYVWQGDVPADDDDGDAGDPITTLPVDQAENACTFSYAGASLAAGTYTIAFTGDAASDVANQDNTLQFVGRRVVTVGAGGSTQNFAAARILQVGPTRPYTTVRAANDDAQAGDVIEIDAGTYTDDISVWRQNNVTLRGVGGGRAHMRAVALIPFSGGNDQANGKGIWVIQGTGTRIENMEFSGSRVPDGNGAGIRQEGRDVVICNNYFHDNENGILGGAYGTLTIEYTEFNNNGFGDIGRTHNIYVDEGDKLIFRHNYSHHANIGHLLKTRAAQNHILYNRLMDEDNGDSSYVIDMPNGGLNFVIGNLLQQSPQTDNPTIVNYGAEGLTGGRTHEFYLINNTFVNDLGSGIFVETAGGASVFKSTNNLFIGTGTVYAGKAPQATTNLNTTAAGLVNIDGYDYRLTSGSPARNAGSDPGVAGSVALTPQYQYTHPANRAPRTANGVIDIGAYEF
jgi:hypothetical protein